MPGFDKTGPLGNGPITGHRMGRCTNYGMGSKKADNAGTDETDVRLQDNLPGRGLGFGRRPGVGKGMKRGTGRKNRFGNNS